MLDAGGGGGGYGGYQIYQMVEPNAAYSESMGNKSTGASDSAVSHDDAAVELAGIRGSLADSWRGKAAEGAKGELDMLQKLSADAASNNLRPASDSMWNQSGTHSSTRSALEPMPERPKDANPVKELFGMESQEEYNAEWSAQNRHNVTVYGTYSDATLSNTDPLSKDFPEIADSKWTDLEGPKTGTKIGSGKDGFDGNDSGSSSSTHSSGFTGDSSGSSNNTGGNNTGGGNTGGGDGGGPIKLPDGSIKYPDGTIVHPDGSKTLPDGTKVLPNGTRILPDGTKVLPDGTRILPNGTKIMPDGTIIRPNGQVIPPGTTSSSGLSSGSDNAASTGLLAGGGVPGAGAGAGAGSGAGGALGAGGFGPGAGAGAGAGAGMGAGKGMGAMPPGGAAGGGMGKGAGAMGRGGMGGMMGGGGAGRGGQGGDDDGDHKDQYYIKQELDPGLHVEYDEFGEKLIDDNTGLTVVPPVIGE